MSEKDIERDDQAAELRKLVNEVEGKETTDLHTEKKLNSADENDPVALNEPTREIDILNLPPRKEIHSNTLRRTRVKVSRPFARFGMVIIVLAIIIFVVYYLWSEELFQFPFHV